MCKEGAAMYTKLFDNLKERGIEKVWIVMSDVYKGKYPQTIVTLEERGNPFGISVFRQTDARQIASTIL